jgi:hypothetical protein
MRLTTHHGDAGRGKNNMQTENYGVVTNIQHGNQKQGLLENRSLASTHISPTAQKIP